MTVDEYIEEIRLKVTGGLLELEIDDDTLVKILNSSFRELKRYYHATSLMKLPFSKCIDLSGKFVKQVVSVHRTEGYLNSGSEVGSGSNVDPMYAAQWQILGGTGNIAGYQDWVSNFASWSMIQQTRSTLSTDLAFRWDKASNKLYINIAMDYPQFISICYIPDIQTVEDITSEYWIDILMRLAVANTKILLGRIRSRYTNTSQLWTQDGETMLAEGNAEMADLREKLLANATLSYTYD